MEAKEILEMITCPVCMELCEAPILQCTQGHVLCGVCKTTLETKARSENTVLIRCPVCRDVCREWSRNLSLEKMAAAFLQTHAYPCPNDCGVALTYGKAAEHIAGCRSTGIACLVASCEKRISRAGMVQHVLSAHRELKSLACTAGGAAINLGVVEPTEFVAFSPKGSSHGHYILCVYAGGEVVASWLLVKRHRKSHVDIALECIHAQEGYKNMAYTLTAFDSQGTHQAMTITSTTLRIRNEEEKGVVIKDTPAYAMKTFQVDAKNQSTVRLQVSDPKTEGSSRKRRRIDISSDGEDEDEVMNIDIDK
jgi:hypothetical protein